jgi:hypothetical protein
MSKRKPAIWPISNLASFQNLSRYSKLEGVTPVFRFVGDTQNTCKICTNITLPITMLTNFFLELVSFQKNVDLSCLPY